MTDASDEQPEREAEPQTHAEAVTRLRESKLTEQVEPKVQSEESPGALRPKKGE